MTKVNNYYCLQCEHDASSRVKYFVVLLLCTRKPGSGEAANKPSSRTSSGGHEKPVADRKKEPDARERRRKEMMQNQVDRVFYLKQKKSDATLN